MPSAGARQLREISAQLKLAGAPATGLRRNLRRNLRVAVEPMRAQARTNALSIPAEGGRSTGLRTAIANAVSIRTNLGSARTVLVRILVDPKKMPAGQQTLPALMEGVRSWRHPVYGDTGVWVPQDAHPYFTRAVESRLPGVQVAVLAALDETTAALMRG